MDHILSACSVSFRSGRAKEQRQARAESLTLTTTASANISGTAFLHKPTDGVMVTPPASRIQSGKPLFYASKNPMHRKGPAVIAQCHLVGPAFFSVDRESARRSASDLDRDGETEASRQNE